MYIDVEHKQDAVFLLSMTISLFWSYPPEGNKTNFLFVIVFSTVRQEMYEQDINIYHNLFLQHRTQLWYSCDNVCIYSRVKLLFMKQSYNELECYPMIGSNVIGVTQCLVLEKKFVFFTVVVCRNSG